MLAPGSSDLAIGISLILRDQFSGAAASAQQSFSNLSAGAQGAIAAQNNLERNFNATGAAIGGAAIGVMANMVKVGAGFDQTITYISKIADEKGGIGFDSLSKRALQLGQDSMYSANQVADAMKYLAMSGMDTGEIYNNVAGAVALSSATMSELGGKLGSADIMTNIMRAFQIEGTEENAMRVADILSKGVTSANTNLTDFAEAMKYAQSTAHMLNISLEETAAMLMLAGDAGIQGSMAGTATENMLRYLSRVTDEARAGSRQGKALSAMGLSPEDLKTSTGELKSMSEIFKLLGTQARGMGNTTLVNRLQDIFGVRGAREASLMLLQIENYDSHLHKLMYQSSGTALENQKSLMATTKGLMDEAISTLETFSVVWLHQIKPLLDPLIKTFQFVVEAASKLMQTPLGGWVTKFATGWIVLRTIVMGYRAIMLTMGTLHGRMTGQILQAGTAGKAALTGMTQQAGVYNGVTSRTVALVTQQRLTQQQLIQLQVKQTAAVLKTVEAEHALTAAQRRRISMVTATATGAGAAGMMGYGLGGMLGPAAATGIGAWLARRGLGTFSYVGNDGRQRGVHGNTNRYITTGSKPMGYSLGHGGRVSKFGNFMGKGGGIGAMVGGMALQMGGEALGTDTTAGAIASGLGGALGWAGTGAMVGSMFGPIGTAVGAIVGGVGSLGFTLYEHLSQAERAVDAANREAQQQGGKAFWKDEAWREKAKKILNTADGGRIMLLGPKELTKDKDGKISEVVTNPAFVPGKEHSTKIIINIDGQQTMDREITSSLFDEIINIGQY